MNTADGEISRDINSSDSEERVKVIYIASPRYSGSTVLTLLMATHPAIATIGERRKFFAKAFHDYIGRVEVCSCGVPFAECPYWLELRERMSPSLELPRLGKNFSQFRFYPQWRLNRWAESHAKRIILSGRPLNAWHPVDRKLKRMCRANEILIDSVLDQSEGSVFLDSSKPLSHALYLSQIERYDVMLIQLTRDVRGQVCSAMRTNKWSVEKATQEWVHEIEGNREILSQWDAPRIVVKHEDLCLQTDETLARIFSFVGLEWAGYSGDFRQREHHIMGNNMRLGGTSQVQLNEKWREELSVEQLGFIEQTAGELNRSLGYE